jgi:hypothetical protein
VVRERVSLIDVRVAGVETRLEGRSGMLGAIVRALAGLID